MSGLLAYMRQTLRHLLLAAAMTLVSAADAVSADERREGVGPALVTNQGQDKAARFLETVQICRSPSQRDRTIRVFIDGAFDLTHFGHFNAFRQAKSRGDYLIVGVNSDKTIGEAKGVFPVLKDAERQAVVSACRFVDEIVPASPYIMTEEYIQELIASHDIDYFVHGDDPCIVDGRDVYEAARKAGKFKTIPRTEGISTTDIVGRLLLATKDHHQEIVVDPDTSSAPPSHPPAPLVSTSSFACHQSQFLVTSQLMRAFSSTLPKAGKKSRVVYVDGAWDMFHAGHAALLSKAREYGDSLIVGVHSDSVVNANRGRNYPIMAMHERVLSVLGCRYTDDVLLDAPWNITQELIATLQISVVVRGTIRDTEERGTGQHDPHEVPKALGIHAEVDSDWPLTLVDIAGRLYDRRAEMEAHQAGKHQKDRARYWEKHGLARARTQ